MPSFFCAADDRFFAIDYNTTENKGQEPQKRRPARAGGGKKGGCGVFSPSVRTDAVEKSTTRVVLFLCKTAFFYLKGTILK